MPTNPQFSKLARTVWHRTAIILIAFVALATARPAAADIAIAPAYVDLAIDEGPATGSFHISNLGEVDERFRINITYFVYGKDGKFALVPGGPYSLADWIKLNPRELDIAAKSERTVRFAVVPPKGLAPGEYWAGIQLESLRKSRAETITDAGARMGVDLVTSVIVPVFGRKGRVSYAGSLKDAALVVSPDRAPTIGVVVVNSGDGRFLAEGEYTVVNASGTTVATGTIGPGHVYRSNERLFSKPLDVPIAPGPYTVNIRFKAKELKAPIEISAPVAWKEAKSAGR